MNTTTGNGSRRQTCYNILCYK